MSEWDERFARLQGLFKERINQAVPKGDPLGFAEPSEWMIIRGLRDLARESRAQLAALRAVVEEARDELDLIYDSGAMQVGANVKLIELFDRGLKGSGE